MCHSNIRLASSVGLLACLFFVAGCSNSQNKPVNTLPVNEKAVDTSNVGSIANSDTTPQPSEHTFIVDINKMKFNPDQLTVHKGDTVVWMNSDLTNHCVTANDKAWTSSTLVPGKYWVKVITKNEDYFCAIHVVMKGKIRVK